MSLVLRWNALSAIYKSQSHFVFLCVLRLPLSSFVSFVVQIFCAVRFVWFEEPRG